MATMFCCFVELCWKIGARCSATTARFHCCHIITKLRETVVMVSVNSERYKMGWHKIRVQQTHRHTHNVNIISRGLLTDNRISVCSFALPLYNAHVVEATPNDKSDVLKSKWNNNEEQEKKRIQFMTNRCQSNKPIKCEFSNTYDSNE